MKPRIRLQNNGVAEITDGTRTEYVVRPQYLLSIKPLTAEESARLLDRLLWREICTWVLRMQPVNTGAKHA